MNYLKNPETDNELFKLRIQNKKIVKDRLYLYLASSNEFLKWKNQREKQKRRELDDFIYKLKNGLLED